MYACVCVCVYGHFVSMCACALCILWLWNCISWMVMCYDASLSPCCPQHSKCRPTPPPIWWPCWVVVISVAMAPVERRTRSSKRFHTQKKNTKIMQIEANAASWGLCEIPIEVAGRNVWWTQSRWKINDDDATCWSRKCLKLTHKKKTKLKKRLTRTLKLLKFHW